MAAEQAKERGNKLFAEGKFQEAVASFNEAIEVDKKSPEGNRHIYYSNRSAAYLSFGEAQKALEDAEECISIKNDWPKGYSRKGAALFRLNRYADAVLAYSTGLARDPSNNGLIKGKADAEKALQQYATPKAAAAASSPGEGLRGFIMGDKNQQFHFFQFVLRGLLLLLMVLYVLPILVSSRTAFSSFLKVSIVLKSTSILWNYGRPKWTTDYARQVLTDTTTHYLFFSLLFLLSNPYLIAMVPILLTEGFLFAWYLSQLLNQVNSPLLPTLAGVVNPIAGKVFSHQLWDSLTSDRKWKHVQSELPEMAGFFTVLIGLSLLFELLTPNRNFMMTVIYWQYLRLMYVLSPPVAKGFSKLDATIRKGTTHASCPSIITRGYAKLSTKLSEMAAPPTQEQVNAQRESMSKCTIM